MAEMGQIDTSIPLNGIKNTLGTYTDTQKSLAELPGVQADSNLKVANAQLKQREVAGLLALQKASQENTTVNDDGTMTVNGPGVSSSLAKQGFGDLAQKYMDNHLKLAESETSLTRNANSYLANAVAHGQTPEQRAQIFKSGTTNIHQKYGVNPPLEVLDGNGNVDDNKLLSWTNSAMAGAQTPQETANVGQTQANTAATEGNLTTNQIINNTTKQQQDLNSPSRKAVIATLRAAGITDDQIGNRTEANLRNDPVLGKLIDSNITPVETKVDAGNILQNEANKQQQISTAMSILRSIPEKQRYKFSIKGFSVDDIRRALGDTNFSKLDEAIKSVNQGSNLDLDISNGTEALLGQLQSEFKNSVGKQQRARAITKSITPGQAADAVEKVPVNEPEPVKPVVNILKPIWAN